MHRLNRAEEPRTAFWPSFALMASYELLTRQVCRSSAPAGCSVRQPQRTRALPAPAARSEAAAELRLVCPPELGTGTTIGHLLICSGVPGCQ